MLIGVLDRILFRNNMLVTLSLLTQTVVQIFSRIKISYLDCNLVTFDTLLQRFLMMHL